jgi:hypothetical protein
MYFNINNFSYELAKKAVGWRSFLVTYQKLTATDSVSIVKGCLRIKNPPKNILFSPNRRAFK